MKGKLVIAGRTNWENKVYIKIKVEEKIMKVITKLIEEFGDADYFIDNQATPKTLLRYSEWKDTLIPITTKNFGIDIICGCNMIHMIFYKFKDFESINKILDKYCIWAEPKKTTK